MPAETTQLFRLIYASRDRIRADDRRAELGELFTVARRNNKQLTVTGALERDAIVSSLRESGGDKRKAAEALGISRATIYRRIHGYGIVVPV